MITLTDAAKKELDAFFASQPETKKSVRVYLGGGGCSGPMLTMALDDAGEGDKVEEVGGIVFCMEKALADKAGKVSVDVGYMGFMLMPEHPVVDPSQFTGGCASCGCTGCGGH